MFKRLILFFLGIFFLSSCAVNSEISPEAFSRLSCDEKVDYIIKRNEKLNNQNWYFESLMDSKNLKIKNVGIEEPDEAIILSRPVFINIDRFIELGAKENPEKVDPFIKALLATFFSQIIVETRVNKKDKVGETCIKIGDEKECVEKKLDMDVYIEPRIGLALFDKNDIKNYSCNGNKVNIHLKNSQNLVYEYFFLKEAEDSDGKYIIYYKDNKPSKIKVIMKEGSIDDIISEGKLSKNRNELNQLLQDVKEFYIEVKHLETVDKEKLYDLRKNLIKKLFENNY